mgnify:CR=1 FL=1
MYGCRHSFPVRVVKLDYVFRVPPPSLLEDLDLEVTDLEVTDLVFDIFPKHPFLDVLAKFKIFFENISENSLKIV